MHATLRSEGSVIGVMPIYLKGNSEGGCVFDHAIARFAYERAGVAYYPKLVVAAPFTPATGPKMLLAPEHRTRATRQVFAAGLAELCERLGASSAHILFPLDDEVADLTAANMAHRAGLQYHWHNAGYGSFDDFLSRFNSKRRNQIRRERREAESQGTIVETLTGRDLTPEIVDLAYEFYVSTVDKYFYGRRYLNRAFFEEICARIPDQIMVVLARDRASKKPLAGAFNLLGSDALYGRYWGAREERSCLHFNVCYYHGIEESIQRGLRVFEPGAGGEHKLARGFEPTMTHSTHWFLDAALGGAVRDFLVRERSAIEEHVAEYRKRPMLRGLAGC
jgi:predicted N-acyltransferase